MNGNDRCTVGITGVAGMLGWHLRTFLQTEPRIDVIPCDRAAFGDDAYLEDLVQRCDAIIHLAGMNRGEQAELLRTNVALAERLVEFLERARSRATVIYSSSTHIDRETAYGRSKRQAGQILQAWAERAGARCVVLVLPHVYGEGGKPFYNSVVSTFCYQLAHQQTPIVNSDSTLELLHAQDVSRTIRDAVLGDESGVRRVSGEPLSVLALLERLQTISAQYAAMVIPDLSTKLEVRLFNTYRSYLFPQHYPVAYQMNRDHRGELFECVRSLHGGQCFVSVTRPGNTRGNHFHTRKFERFAVIGGEGVIRLRKLFDTIVYEFSVQGTEPVFVDMPTLHTHSIENTGSSDMVTLFWSHEFFDSTDPDTYQEPVCQ